MTDIGTAASGTSDPGPYTTGMSENQIFAREYKERQGDKQALQKNLKETDALKIPEYPKMQEMPKPETTPMNGWGSAATFLATFGSMLTRRPLANALNANADVMDAVKQQDADKFQKAWDAAKLANENAQKAAEWQMNVYKELVGKKESEQRVILGMMKDDTGQQALDAKKFRAHEAAFAKQTSALSSYNNLLMKDAELAGKEYDGKAKAEGTWTEKGRADAMIAAYKQDKSKDEPESETQKKYEDWKKKPSAKDDADSYANGAPLASFTKSRGKDGERYLQFVKDYAQELHPELNRANAVEDYNAANKAVSSFGDGKHGDVVRSFDVAYEHADLVGDLADALGNGNVQKINQLSQAYEEEFGSPAPTNFDAAKNILADEINKAAVGGAGALADRQALADNVKRASSPDQIHGTLQTYKGLIIGQMHGIGRQYKEATKRNDFTRLLSPEVKRDFEKHGKAMKSVKSDKSPDAKHIKMLKDNPSEENKSYFDEAFGEGAAAKALGE